MRYLLVALLFLTACSGDARRQHAADAISGTEALVLEDSASARAVTAPGVVAHIEGAVGARREALPPPRRSPAEIRQSPQAYTTEAIKERDATLSSLGILGWVAGGAALLLGAIKATGLGGPAVQILAGILQSKAQKMAGQKTQHIAEAGNVLVQVIESMPNDGTIADLKKRIAKVAPPEAIAVIHEVKAQVSKTEAAG
jgi:hypothetical protein